jgi:hypothetical protein
VAILSGLRPPGTGTICAVDAGEIPTKKRQKELLPRLGSDRRSSTAADEIQAARALPVELRPRANVGADVCSRSYKWDRRGLAPKVPARRDEGPTSKPSSSSPIHRPPPATSRDSRMHERKTTVRGAPWRAVNSSRPDRRARKHLSPHRLAAVLYHLIELGVTSLRLWQDYAYQGGTQLAQDQRQADGRATH